VAKASELPELLALAKLEQSSCLAVPVTEMQSATGRAPASAQPLLFLSLEHLACSLAGAKVPSEHLSIQLLEPNLAPQMTRVAVCCSCE